MGSDRELRASGGWLCEHVQYDWQTSKTAKARTMTRTSPAGVAAAYFDAWQHKDIERVRPLLHEDVSFVGALGATNGIDQTLAGLGGMFAMTDRVEVVKR